MAEDLRFVPNDDGRICPTCGSLLGWIVSGDHPPEGEPSCPAPHARPDGRTPACVDPSYLYRGFALIFEPQEVVERSTDGAHDVERGVIRAVRPEWVHDPVARKRSPIVAVDVLWPNDRKRFAELFDHHVHHVAAPHVTPLNDGWDASRPLPVL